MPVTITQVLETARSAHEKADPQTKVLDTVLAALKTVGLAVNDNTGEVYDPGAGARSPTMPRQRNVRFAGMNRGGRRY